MRLGLEWSKVKLNKTEFMKLKNPLNRLRVLAHLEGFSYLLLGITMPLKYMLEIREPNFYVGMAHGWLFILYVIISIQNIYINKWGLKITFFVLTASLIPFATFLLDAKILKPLYVQRSIESV
jgi:integral membrane protein